jgi:hypothetical protein
MPNIEEAFAPGFKLKIKENCKISFYLIGSQSDVLLTDNLIKPPRRKYISSRNRNLT